MKKARFAIPSTMSLSRLRGAFIALGLVLLGGLVSLSLAVQERLSEAERERKEMVALRTFDELEREVSAFLDIENEREPYRNLRGSDPQAWAPFVVGYFRSEGGRSEVVAADGKTSENQRRLNWAIASAESRWAPSEQAPREEERPQPSPIQVQVPATSPGAPPKPKSKDDQVLKQRTGSKIISQLNRAPERRKAPKKPSSTNAPLKEDQFLDYQERF